VKIPLTLAILLAIVTFGSVGFSHVQQPAKSRARHLGAAPAYDKIK
jgi:hypothetical protein